MKDENLSLIEKRILDMKTCEFYKNIRKIVSSVGYQRRELCDSTGVFTGEFEEFVTKLIVDGLTSKRLPNLSDIKIPDRLKEQFLEDGIRELLTKVPAKTSEVGEV